jgi:anaerobic selenocysteine-containing dehydrogenase
MPSPPAGNPADLPVLRHSVCALDCPDCCALVLTVDPQNGRATRLRGDPDHPVTRGFLCGKVARYLERQYSSERLLRPMKRTGAKGEGRFERITWDEALETVAARLGSIAREHGPESVLPYSYGGNMGYLNGGGMDRRFFHRLGASRLDRTICSTAGAAGIEASMGFRYGTEPEQFVHSRLIIAWGANIMGTNVHLWPFIVEARRKGAKFYVIDPVKNRTGRLADRHYPVNPGSDLALALGLMHVIIAEDLCDRDYIDRHTIGFDSLAGLAAEYPPERTAALTGLAAADIAALAREYATTQPAVIRLNYGMQRSERGGKAVQAITMLPALTGSWRHLGGGFQLSTGGAYHLNKASLERPDLQRVSPLGREARIVNMSLLGHALTELDNPPVKALVVYNSNPAAIAPDQNGVLAGLRRADLFTVVLEQFQTDTADYADIVLPVTTFLENTDLYMAYGHYYLQMARPALQAAGQARSNVAIFRELAGRMGFSEPCFIESEDDMIRGLLDTPHRFFAGITIEELDRHHRARLRVAADGAPFLPFTDGGYGTPSGKCDLSAESLAYVPPVESRHGDAALRRRYPLEMIAAKSDEGMNTTFGYRDDVDEATSVAVLHPDDAAARGIADGNLVRLFNDRGSATRTARIDAGAVRAGTLSAPSTRWNKKSHLGRGINTLTSQRLTDIGGGATFYSCLVQVEKCGD